MNINGGGMLEPTIGYFNQMTDDFDAGERSGASVVVVDNIAYIMGGKGKNNIYYDEIIPCQFTEPLSGSPNSYTFLWGKRMQVSSQLGDLFKPRAFGVAFSVDGKIYFGLGEDLDENGDKIYYSDMIQYDRNTTKFSLRSNYMNEDAPSSRVSRAMVINGGDRAFVTGGEKQGSGITERNTSEWVYRP